ncbi:hypothetical protein BDZ85DRAFT_267212 [Elsinoe ampelina]|uniref:Uncharacterized protein n=1 Tax=Elsinoe ampelina TaxID=302913 RepID=A0A6A6G3U1_9PEZI|nr:hypothetical protein BDZ85DRAFT_267212 [Elsinoe ampelina]
MRWCTLRSPAEPKVTPKAGTFRRSSARCVMRTTAAVPSRPLVACRVDAKLGGIWMDCDE